MKRSNMRALLLRTTMVATLTASGSAIASAQTTEVNGGGATLAGPTYGKVFADQGLHAGTSCSTSADIYYAPVGSGKGTIGFLNNDPSQIGCSGVAVDYGVGDEPIQNVVPGGSATFKSTYGYQLIQVPAFGVGVAIVESIAKYATNGSLKLTDAQLCGIFSGAITTLKVGNQQATISVAYRADSSGTSFLLTNHLSVVCKGVPTNGITFVGTTKLATLFPGYTTDASGNTFIPTNSYPTFNQPSIGSSALQANVHNKPNTLGAIGTDYTLLASAPNNPSLASPVAKVNGLLPTNGTNGADDITPALKIPKPSANNPDSWGVDNPNPAKGYAIVGYSYLYLSSQYDSQADIGVLTTFLNGVYNVDGSATQAYNDIKSGGFVTVQGVQKSAAPTSGLAKLVVKDYLAKNAVVPITATANGR